MAKIYETGNKNYVIRMACRHAIDCIEVDIESYNIQANDLPYCHPGSYIGQCQAEIRDFKKLIERSYP